MEIYLKTKKILGESNIANQNWGEKKKQTKNPTTTTKKNQKPQKQALKTGLSA